MGDFVSTVLSLPTVIFTVPLLLSLIYWVFVVIGAVDLDALDALDGADGALEGGLDGAADGALDGALDGLDGLDGLDALDGNGFPGLDALDGALDGIDGAFEGAGDAALDGLDADADVDGHGPGLLAVMLSTLKLTTVPLTVSLSFIVLFSWLASFLMTVHVAPLLPVPELLSGAAIALSAFTAGTLGASVAVRPLGGLFHTERGRGNRSFIGVVVTITTGKVTKTFGQAEVTEAGHHNIVQVRDRSEQGLSKGDRALLVQWDREGEAFVVEKLDVKAAEGDVQAARLAAIDRVRARVAARRKQSN
ncbi:MAG: glycine zipper family protein [Deltaproteobacteria bacterium]|nr:glycine zipper family protein [Deltaproteobacteria bacterium]